MNPMILKIFLVISCIFLLSGCQQQHDYAYLMQHPEVLQKEYENCRRITSAYCDEVVRAAEDFRVLVLQRSENPELMGWQIMQAQQKGDEQKVRTLYAVVRSTSQE